MKFRSNYFSPSLPVAEYLLGIILLIYPALYFAVQGGMNGSLFLIAIISLTLLIKIPKTNGENFDNSAIIFSIAMASGLIVALISQLYHQDLTARYFDSASRFLLAVPILLALRKVDLKTLCVIQYSFPMGAIAAMMAVMISHPTLRYNASTHFLNQIHLGDAAILLGFLSAFSIDWVKKDRLIVRMLKMSGLAAGVIMSVLSSARGAWIATPVFLAVFVYFRFRGSLPIKAALATVLFGASGLLGYFFIESIHLRLWMVYSDLSQFSNGNIDTSIGIRLQLWKAAFHLIAENPILGVGADGFMQAMDGLSASGFITPVAAQLGKGEVHNEILAQTVRFGIFGFLSILAIYFVPFFLFLRAAKSGTHQQNVASMMGMCVTLGFFVFGLTVETFDLKMTAAFYSLTVAVLLAVAIHKPSLSEKTN